MKRLAIAALLGCVVQFATGHAQELPAPPSAPPPPAPSAPPAQTPPPAQPPAQPPAASEENRFTYYRVQDTFVRLDLRTGQVATCARGAGGWTCQAAPDERTALEAEIGRLQSENAALKKELLKRGLALPGGVRPEPVPPVADARPQPKDAPQTPGGSEVERVKTLLGDVWRRLVEMVAELQRDIQRRI